MLCRFSPRSAGPVAPEKWRGALPITYHIGPGPAKVHLKVTSNWDMKPVNDVIATLRGSGAPDQWVIRGNHFDAWVNGADDPLSGMSAVLEEARMLGELHKQGWTPEAHHHLLRLGRRRTRTCSVPPNGLKLTATNCKSMPSPTSIPTATAADFFTPPARTIWRN